MIMIKNLIAGLVMILFCGAEAYSQKIYSANTESRADIKVYVVDV